MRFHHVKNVCFPWSNSTLRHSENACSKTLQAKRFGAILGDFSANLTQNDQKGVVKRSDPEQRFRDVKKAPKRFACNTFRDVQNTISKPFEERPKCSRYAVEKRIEQECHGGRRKKLHETCFSATRFHNTATPSRRSCAAPGPTVEARAARHLYHRANPKVSPDICAERFSNRSETQLWFPSRVRLQIVCGGHRSQR